MNDSGSVVFDTAEKLELWRRHYAVMGSGDESLLALDEQQYIMGPPPEITVKDTEDSLRRSKAKKTPGLSEISVEILCVGGRPVVEILTKIFNSIIKCQKTGKIQLQSAFIRKKEML